MEQLLGGAKLPLWLLLLSLTCQLTVIKIPSLNGNMCEKGPEQVLRSYVFFMVREPIVSSAYS